MTPSSQIEPGGRREGRVGDGVAIFLAYNKVLKVFSSV